MKRIVSYLGEARVEFSKVTWPTRRQAIRLTILVVAFSIIFSIAIGALDWVFAEVLQRLILQSK
jgi:preprotein translocase subunit SecE